MTREEWKERLPLIQAYVEGKVIEYHCQVWEIITDPSFDESIERYRIKLEKKLRPWSPKEVPVGALLQHPEAHNDCISMIVGKTASGLVQYCAVWDPLQPYTGASVEDMVTYKHSLDHGKTWLPCGVLE